MRELDETDLEILSLLAVNARRPFSAIGQEVGLSGPAVSDRVQRLQDAGVINRFTIDVNRSQLRRGVPVFVRLAVPASSIEAVRARLRDAEGVEHVFVTAESDLWFYGWAAPGNVRNWVDTLLADVEPVRLTITLVDEVEWTPAIEGLEFALSCAECGNTVDSEGETARIDGEVYHFCCQSCQRRFEARYERLAEGA